MTQWGMALLLAYVGLGLSGAAWRKSAHIAILITIVALAGAFAQYGALR